MNIIVSYYQFSISSPYSAGPTTLTPGEAQALNLLRADNLRKFCQRVIASYELGDNQLLSSVELAYIQSRLNQYSSSFKFKVRELEDRQSLLQKEYESIASQLHDGGKDFLANPNFYPELEQEARRRLTARSAAISPSDLGF